MGTRKAPGTMVSAKVAMGSDADTQMGTSGRFCSRYPVQAPISKIVEISDFFFSMGGRNLFLVDGHAKNSEFVTYNGQKKLAPISKVSLPGKWRVAIPVEQTS